MQEDLERVLFNEQTILRRLDEMAAEISRDYRDRELTVIAVLNGSIIFMADLLRRIPLPLKLDCLGVASYHGGTKSTGEVIFQADRVARYRRPPRSYSRRHSRQRAEPGGDSRKIGNREAADGSHLRSFAQTQSARARRCMRIISVSTSKTNSLSVTASITWSAIATCRASASSGKT